MRQKSLISISEKEALEFLKSKGYEISKPSPETRSRKIKAVQEFYEGMRRLLGDMRFALILGNEKSDREAVDRYVAKAKIRNIPEAEALDSLSGFIHLFFKYYAELGLKSPPSSLGFLLSKNGNWICTKVAEMHNRKREELANSPAVQEYFEAIYNDCSDEKFLKLQEKRHEELLNGKKERS